MKHIHTDAQIVFVPPAGSEPLLIRRTCACGAHRDISLPKSGTFTDTGWFYGLEEGQSCEPSEHSGS